MNLKCKAIIFDYDGVLVDSNAVFERHWKNWAEARGVSFEHIQAVHHGIPPKTTIGIVAPHLDAASEAERFVRYASGDLEGVVAMHGAHEILSNLPSGRWAIATSSFRQIVLPRLALLQLPEPGVLITTEDVSRGKPAPDPYLAAARKLGYDPSMCIVIEDAPAGIDAAKAAGARVIAVSSTHPEEALRAADVIVGQLSDLEIYEEEEIIHIDVKNDVRFH